MEYELGTRRNHGLCVDLIWIGLDLILIGLDLIWFDIDIDWMKVWFDLIKTLWYCKQVKIGVEWKSNVDDSAPMSKVEDMMKSWIRRRREWN